MFSSDVNRSTSALPKRSQIEPTRTAEPSQAGPEGLYPRRGQVGPVYNRVEGHADEHDILCQQERALLPINDEPQTLQMGHQKIRVRSGQSQHRSKGHPNRLGLTHPARAAGGVHSPGSL